MDKPSWAKTGNLVNMVIGMLGQKYSTGQPIEVIPELLQLYVTRKEIYVDEGQSVARKVHEFWRAAQAKKSPEQKAVTLAKLRD